MKWKYFVSASFLTTVLLLQAGAPFAAVAGGIGAAFLLNWRKHRNNLLKSEGKIAARS